MCLLVCTVSGNIQAIGTGEELGLYLSRVIASCLTCCLFLRHRGRFPWWGGFRTPRYHGPLGCLLRKRRAAHGPRHPAVIIPLRLCLLGVRFFVRCFLGICMVSCVGVLVFGVELLFGLVPFKTCPLFAFGVRSPLFFLSSCWDVCRRRFFLFFSLSGAGETQTPCGVWDSPCVSSTWPRTTSSTRTPCSTSSPRFRSRSCFVFFFSPSSFAGMVVVGYGLLGLSLCGGLFFWVWFSSGLSCMRM